MRTETVTLYKFDEFLTANEYEFDEDGDLF
jgi:hypothetical protein